MNTASAPQHCSLKHIAIIMDGNGRWATQRGLSRKDGHKAGTEAARKIVEECLELGIHHLTLYTFSQENWNRPTDEVSYLFELLVKFITVELPDLEKKGVQLRVLGDVEGLPFSVRQALRHAISRTSANTAMILNLALNYSGQEEIVLACKRFMASGKPASALTPQELSQYLYTHDQPDPDLVIRTSGEIRISNFLTFQTAYSEFFFTETLWPDFTPRHLHEAIDNYSLRQRRYGALPAQSSS